MVSLLYHMFCLSTTTYFLAKSGVVLNWKLLQCIVSNVLLQENHMLDVALRTQCMFFSGFVLDKVDNSVTRSDPYFRELFKRCGLYILSVKVNIQKC